MRLTSNFNQAIEDYFVFLQKGYPQKNILKLVGDRYKLSRIERSMLYRGISTEAENELRAKKHISVKSVEGKDLFVDCFNQIYTIASYLNGNIVFISSDGFLRDASEMHSKSFRSDLLERSVGLIYVYSQTFNPKQFIFYIDQQVNISEEMKFLLNKIFFGSQIIVSDQVDKSLVKITGDIIATSDSQIIDSTHQKFFDLAHATLKFHFNPLFFSFNSLLHKKL